MVLKSSDITGEIVGSILAGVSYQVLHLHTDLPYAVTLVVSSVTTILIPWSPSLPAAGLAFCLIGIGEGFIDIGNCTLYCFISIFNMEYITHMMLICLICWYVGLDMFE